MKPKLFWTLIRRLSQGLILLFFIYIIWTTRYPLQGFINPKAIFQIDPLVMVLTAVAERIILPGLIFALVTLLISLIFGRIFCGWFCPLGTTLDIWAWLTRPFRGRGKGENEPGKAKNIKYLILIVIFGFAFAGIQAAWFFDPITIFVRTFSFNIHPFVNGLIDNSLAYLIRITNFPQWLEAFYYKLKEIFLEITNPAFPHSVYILEIFVILLILVLFKRRFWCRYLCPLGGMLAVFSRFTPFRRRFSYKGAFSTCRNVCRMNAIRTDNTYLPEECVLCMDCVDYCPHLKTTFSFKDVYSAKQNNKSEKGISRAEFLKWMGAGLFFLTGSRSLPGAIKGKRAVIRPPAALPENEFVQRCIRCGNCMKVCPTNVLQPSLLESGFSGVWTPRFNTRLGYCEYKCTLCGRVCPTGAIKEIGLEEKMRTKMGLAVIDRSICIPWAKGTECIVCEEHCPVSSKAIKLTQRIMPDGRILKLPSIDPNLCVGCAICENKCPVDPVRAIRVNPL